MLNLFIVLKGVLSPEFLVPFKGSSKLSFVKKTSNLLNFRFLYGNFKRFLKDAQSHNKASQRVGLAQLMTERHCEGSVSGLGNRRLGFNPTSFCGVKKRAFSLSRVMLNLIQHLKMQVFNYETLNRVQGDGCGLKACRAFSLVEMLMALLVASLLMAALAPVMTKRMDEAKINISGVGAAQYDKDSLISIYTGAPDEDKIFNIPNDVNMIKATLIGGGGAGGNSFYGKQEVTTSTSWTVPEGVTKLRVFMIGGGGGGASGGLGTGVETIPGGGDDKTTTYKDFGEGAHEFTIPSSATKVPALDSKCAASGSTVWKGVADGRDYIPGDVAVSVTACGGGGGGGGAELEQGGGGGGSGGYVENFQLQGSLPSKIYVKVGGGGGGGGSCSETGGTSGGCFAGGGGATHTGTTGNKIGYGASGGTCGGISGGNGGNGSATDGANGTSSNTGTQISYGGTGATGSNIAGSGGRGTNWAGGGGGNSYSAEGGGGGGGGGPTTISTSSGTDESKIIFQIGGGGGGGGDFQTDTSGGAGGGGGGGYGSGGGGGGGGTTRVTTVVTGKGGNGGKSLSSLIGIGIGNPGLNGTNTSTIFDGKGGGGGGGGGYGGADGSTGNQKSEVSGGTRASGGDVISIFGSSFCNGGGGGYIGGTTGNTKYLRGEQGKPGALRLYYTYPDLQCDFHLPANGSGGGGAGQLVVGEIDVTAGETLYFEIGSGGGNQGVAGSDGKAGNPTRIRRGSSSGPVIAEALGGFPGQYSMAETTASLGGSYRDNIAIGVGQTLDSNWTGISYNSKSGAGTNGELAKPESNPNRSNGGKGGDSQNMKGEIVSGGQGGNSVKNGISPLGTSYGAGGGGGAGSRDEHDTTFGTGAAGASGYIYFEYGGSNGGGGTAGEIITKIITNIKGGSELKINIGDGGDNATGDGNGKPTSIEYTTSSIKTLTARGGLRGNDGVIKDVHGEEKLLPCDGAGKYANCSEVSSKGLAGEALHGGVGGYIDKLYENPDGTWATFIKAKDGTIGGPVLGGCGGNLTALMGSILCNGTDSTPAGKDGIYGGGGGGGAVINEVGGLGGRGGKGMVILEYKAVGL